MKQFAKILKFELKNYFENKVFVGVTVALVIVIAAVMFFPRIAGLFDREDPDNVPGISEQTDQEEAEDIPLMLVAGEQEETGIAVQQAFSAAFPGYEVRIFSGDADTLREEILSEKAECAFWMESLTSYTYFVKNLSMYDQNTVIADEVLRSLFRLTALAEQGIPPEEAQEILNAPVSHETESLGKDQVQNFWYTYIMIFALYMVILMYGQMVASGVATEKSSRAMELLVTSAKPVNMMFGKVIAACLAGLIQIVAVFGTSVLCYHLNESYWGGNMFVESIFGMPVDLFLYMLVFFVLGFFIYAFLFGAVGSVASKLEDINVLVMPVTLVFVAGFMIVMFSMAFGNVDSLLMKVCSYIPFTSSMAMFTRIAMSAVPAYEIVLSILILAASVVGVGVLAAKIYRVGVLLYGTPPKIRAIYNAIKKS